MFHQEELPNRPHAEQSTGADALQLSLVPRFSFRAQLTASVRAQTTETVLTAERDNSCGGRHVSPDHMECPEIIRL